VQHIWILLLAITTACGKVSDTPADGPETCDPTRVESCGAACTTCPATDERTVPTCDGTSCGTACVGGAPTCSDGSCSRLAFDFSSNTLDGLISRAPAGLVLAVRNHAGNLALAIDVTDLTEVSFQIPVCLGGSVNFTDKAVSASVMFDGGTATGDQFYVTASVPEPGSGSSLDLASYPANLSKTYQSNLALSQFSNTTTSITFQAGTFGQQFTGTIWFDDLTLL
jgi:hypothetical protein